MKATLEYKDDFLYVVEEKDAANGAAKEWLAVRRADYAEVQTLHGRPVTRVSQHEGIYVDEEGNVYQLATKGEKNPIAVEPLPRTKRTKLEVPLKASPKGKKPQEQNGDSKKVQRKNRTNGRKRHSLPTNGAALQLLRPKTAAASKPSANATSGAAPEAPVRLSLRQKLAEVRRRIGYVQKRGHNERFNYSYVTAADIAGSVGDILAELGVLVIPSLEEISYESAAGRGGATPMARVIMAYTFADVDSDEEVVATAAGQGLDNGDKAPYKAMTGALKYALLQTFLLATGDDPEDERGDAHFNQSNSGRTINAEQVRDLEKRIEDTGTDLQRLLAYYKVASLSELTEFAYRVAVKVLNRKLAKRRNQEAVHAQD
ncbi:ERF family protein [Candidatus Binatus sp.]|uniref:ERF family protein n=1 Tax=Candidatus Binatus sp. TaxID=2811406 RepID=UPI003C8B6C3D